MNMSIVKAFHIGREDVPPTDKIVAILTDSHGRELIKHLGTEEELKTKYLQFHNLSSWPLIGNNSTAPSYQLSTQDSVTLTGTTPSRFTILVQKVLVSVFVTAWAHYMQQDDDNKVTLQLKNCKPTKNSTMPLRKPLVISTWNSLLNQRDSLN